MKKTRKSVGSGPQTRKEWFEARNKKLGIQKTNNQSVLQDAKIQNHRKKFK